jgi:hypothetical protein
MLKSSPAFPLAPSAPRQASRKKQVFLPINVKSKNISLVASARSVRTAGFSGAGFLEEPIIEDRFLDPGRRLLFRRRARGLFLPKPAVLQNLPDHLIFLNE